MNALNPENMTIGVSDSFLARHIAGAVSLDDAAASGRALQRVAPQPRAQPNRAPSNATVADEPLNNKESWLLRVRNCDLVMALRGIGIVIVIVCRQIASRDHGRDRSSYANRDRDDRDRSRERDDRDRGRAVQTLLVIVLGIGFVRSRDRDLDRNRDRDRW